MLLYKAQVYQYLSGDADNKRIYAAGKTIALFGSYGWGDGQWMRDWVDRMNAAGAKVVNGEGLICQETPDDGAIAECESLGKQLAAV